MSDVNPNQTNPQYDMGLMALKGNRPEEAVSIFQNLVNQHPSPGYWSGLAYAKAGLVLKQTSTIEEVAYCFKKAIECDPSQREQGETLFADICLNLMNDLATYCDVLYNQAKKAANRMMLGAATAGLGAVVGLSKRDTLFTNVVGIAGVAGGAATIFNSHSHINDIQCDYSEAIKLYNTIYRTGYSFLTNQSEIHIKFEETSKNFKTKYISISGKKAHRGNSILVFGILGITCFGPFLAIPAWIMGHRDLKLMANDKMDVSGKTRTQIGMILGILSCSILMLIIISAMVK